MADHAAGMVVCECGELSRVGARFCAGCGRSLGSAQPVSDEERRQVTALFADVSGFTTLAGQIDADSLVVVVDSIITGLAEIIERHGGRVGSFVGDAVLGLFGAPVAHEDDAARALRTAGEIHDWLARRSPTPAAPDLTVHIGVNTGLVVARSFQGGARSQYDVLGEPVIIAQRLGAIAPPGQTFVGQLTMQLATGSFDFDDLGPHHVKGRVDPVQVFALRGRHTGRAAAGSRMFGRDEALNVLVDTLHAARTSNSRVVHVVGPAGSGKSRLMTAFRATAAAQPVLFVELIGESTPVVAYQSLAPLFAAALQARYPMGSSTPERLRHLEGDPQAPAAATYTSILLGEPVDDHQLGGQEAQEVGRRVFAAASAWLADLSQRRDLVVTVENLQWLEPSAADLLRDLISNHRQSGVLFALAGRPAPEPDSFSAAAQVIELAPLGTQDVTELIVDELQVAPDSRLVALVHQRSEGNPFMARETVRHLSAHHLLDSRLGHVRLVAGAETRDVPETVEALLSARVDAMSNETVQVATAAAAIGIVVPRRLLAAVTNAAHHHLAAHLDTHVDTLVDARLVTRLNDDELRFDNSTVRDVLYSRLTRRRRETMHARIADAIDDSVRSPDAAAALRAEHRFLAGDVLGALPWLRKVADHARMVYARDDAVVALTRAVESVAAADAPQHNLLPGLLCDLGDVRMELGEYELAGEAYRQAQRPGRDARASAGYGASLRRRGRYAQARAELEAALEDTPVGDARQIWGELSAVLSVSGDLVGSLAAARGGRALGGADDRTAAALLIQMVRAETLLGRFDDARVHITRAIEIFDGAHDEAGLCTALRLLGSLQEMAGELDEAAATLQRGLERAQAIGLVEEIGGCLINLGLVKGALDDHSAAADCYARAAITFERSGNRAGQATAYGNRAYELFVLGDLTHARSLGRDALVLADEVGNRLTSADVHHTLGLIAESDGELATAHAHALSAVRDFEDATMPAAAGASRELAARTAAVVEPTVQP